MQDSKLLFCARHALNASRIAMAPQAPSFESASQDGVHMPPGNPTALVLQAAPLPHADNDARVTRSRSGSALVAMGPTSLGSPTPPLFSGNQMPTVVSPSGASKRSQR